MEEIEIKCPVLQRILGSYFNKILVICCCFPVLILIEVSGIEPKQLPGPLFGAGFIGCVLLLYMVIKKILMIPKRTYLTITDDGIIVNDKCGQWEVCFKEVDSFECERLWRFNILTGNIIVNLKNGNGYVKMFSADGLTVKPKRLCDLLNERLSSYKRNKKR